MKEDWRARLRGDPTRWLLDSDDNHPSVAFWFLRDIVGRPEDAAALLELRDKILFSQPVQEILAHADELGYWDNPDSLDEPRHGATLWTLALAELGIPRASRRARAACEFALENFRLVDQSLAGLLAHALIYFNYSRDARLTPIMDEVAQDAERGNIFALWALADATSRGEVTSPLLLRGVEHILDALACGEYKILGAFPSFDARDALLALRVLAQLNRLGDERARSTIEQVWARQGEGARWALELSYAGSAAARFDIAPEPNKWATLYALEILTRTR